MSVNGILGRKVGMTQLFDDKGDVRPVTVLQAGPCVITQLKTLALDGYEAAQIGLVEFVKNKNVTKPQAGHFAKTEAPPVKVIKEVDLEAVLVGDDVDFQRASSRVVDCRLEVTFSRLGHPGCATVPGRISVRADFRSSFRPRPGHGSA